MPEPARERAPRRRRWRVALIVLVLLGGAIALALRHYTQPEPLAHLLVAQAKDKLGADLRIGGPAHFSFFPHFRIELPHPTLEIRGMQEPLVQAADMRAVVPWRTLWADRIEIDRIELVQPTLDLDALRAWLAARPKSTSEPADVRFSLKVTDGTLLSSGKPIARGLDADFATEGDLAQWLAALQTTAIPALPPLAGSASATSVDWGETHLKGVRIDLDDSAPAAAGSKQR